MKYDILTIGFPLVEIMRKERDVPFDIPADFTGPYPSADTCIVLDVAGRLGRKCCFLGNVGDDLFGRVVIDRLNHDGVDTSYVRVVKGYSTGVTFVRYGLDGTREYLDLINNTAFAKFNSNDVFPEVVANSRWIHLSGEVISTCLDPVRREAILKFLNSIPENAKVSLDPNFTVDLRNIQDIMMPFVDRADLVLPSDGEAKVLMDTETDDEACRTLAEMGKIVALKKGKRGSMIYTGEERISVGSFPVKEVDPTGCGDAFCAGFLTGMLEGWSLEETARFANATGALQATKLGPMEGAKDMDEIMKFIKENQ